MDRIDDDGNIISKEKYEYMEFNNGIHITHSVAYRKNSLKCVNVFFELICDNNIKSCCVVLPTFGVKDCIGFSIKEINAFKEFAKHDALALYEFGDDEAKNI